MPDLKVIAAGSLLEFALKEISFPAGRLKSLHLLLKTFPDISRAFVLSQRPYSELLEQKLVFQPLYTAMNLIDS